MFCFKCGKEIRDDSVFCKFCGERIELEDAGGAVDSVGTDSKPSLQEQLQVMPQATDSQKNRKQKNKLVSIAILGTLLIAGIILAVVLLGGLSGGRFRDAKKGDIITFGSYEQDGNTANGAEPIEWDVLDVQKDRILVVSHYVLDAVPYNTTETDVTWEACSLRKWMNEDFFYDAFSKEEQAAILETEVVNRTVEWHAVTESNTMDKVFCLGFDEIKRYYELSWEFKDIAFASEELFAKATPYAEKRFSSAT